MLAIIQVLVAVVLMATGLPPGAQNCVRGINIGPEAVTWVSAAANPDIASEMYGVGRELAADALLAAKGGVTVASGGGGHAPMSMVRTIAKGEKITDIVNEAKALTFTTGNEHAVVTLASGERALVSGGSGGINFAKGQITRIFGHTHPTPAPPSADDFAALRKLGQSQQTVFHGGEVTKVRP